MRREKSCGAVLFRDLSGERIFLVLHSTQGHWTLCEGHVEPGETEQETAVREIREETGLTVAFVENFRRVVTYSPDPGVTKDVVFFLGRADDGPVSCQPEEVREALFLPLADAVSRLTHPSDQETLEQAAAFLDRTEGNISGLGGETRTL